MRLRISLVSLTSILLLVTPAMPVAATGASGAVDYSGAGSPVTIWCPENSERDYVPSGHPYDELEPGPFDPLQAPWDVIDWALSGEPECLLPDAWAEEGRTGGVGGGAFCYAGSLHGTDCGQHAGHNMTVTAHDVYDAPYFEVDGSGGSCWDTPCPESIASGCGTVTVTLRAPESPWQAVPDEPPTGLAWVRVEAAYADPDTHEVCMGSHGTLEAVW